jgi:signal transduction histidine kinase
MRSFMGVPIVAPHGVIGAFYLTEKIGAPDFADEDEQLIGLLAAHAAIAIANARLYEQSRELSMLAERNRLALELHDAVSQKLFGLVLNAETARTLLERDPASAAGQVEKLQELAQEALDELRSLVFELRPPDLERDGLGGVLRKHVEMLARLEQREIDLELSGDLASDPARDGEVLRIAQEALQNALRHAEASYVAVRLHAADGRIDLEVEDDGVGFDLYADGLRSRRLGLTSMEERAQRLGGKLTIHTAYHRGTVVHLELGGG